MAKSHCVQVSEILMLRIKDRISNEDVLRKFNTITNNHANIKTLIIVILKHFILKY